MALTYFQIPANGSTIDFNVMEDFLSFAQLEDVDTIDSGYIRLERVDAGGEDADLDVDDLRVSMVGGSLDGKSLVLLNVAPEDLSINTLADLNGFVWVGDNNNDGTDEGPLQIWGTSDGDYIMGLDGNDTIRALGDDDVIDMSISSGGGYGQDSIDGGDGVDLLYFGATMTSGVTVNLTTNTVSGGAPDSGAVIFKESTVPGGSSIEDVSGSAFGDSLTGSTGANSLSGLGGNDTLVGGGGADTLSGGDGTDLLAFNMATITAVTVNLATNTATGGMTLSSIENATGTALADSLTGSTGANSLSGLGGNDVVNGGSGNDTLRGGDGNDVLDGGTGTDRLQGDAGNDRLTFGSATETHLGGSGTDTLRLLSSLNLTTIANARVVDIEKIDMTGGGNDTLTVNKSEVLAISSTLDTLTVLGNAGDRVNLMGAFTLQSTAGGYETWKLGAAIVKIETELTVI